MSNILSYRAGLPLGCDDNSSRNEGGIMPTNDWFVTTNKKQTRQIDYFNWNNQEVMQCSGKPKLWPELARGGKNERG